MISVKLLHHRGYRGQLNVMVGADCALLVSNSMWTATTRIDEKMAMFAVIKEGRQNECDEGVRAHM